MNRGCLIYAIAFAVFLVLISSVFIVQEGQSAIVVQLGQVKRAPITKAGLNFKIPLIEEVRLFDARILAWDGDPERIPVKDNKFIFVDTFARWKIIDPLRFYNAVRDENGAQSRLDDILDGSVRDVVSTHYLHELVRTTDQPLESQEAEGDAQGGAIIGDVDPESGLTEADQVGKRMEVRSQIFDISKEKLDGLDLGIELIDLRIKRIDYTEQVEGEVYRRMISQQERVAERYRAQGQGKKAEISGLTSQEEKRIVSESYRRSQEIIGEAEAESTRLYAEAYGKDPELYSFLKSLETYQTIIGDKDMLILSTDSDLLGYIKQQK